MARKPASRSSFKDDDAATDGSRLASYLAASQPDSSSKPARARAPPPQTATARSPARDHAHGDSSDTASPSSNAGDVLLQWGHNKRSRCRRDASSSSSAAPSPQRRLSSGGVNGKIQRRASAPTEKLMPPPPAATAITRGSNLRSASSFPARAAGGDANHHGNNRYTSASPRLVSFSYPGWEARPGGGGSPLLHPSLACTTCLFPPGDFLVSASAPGGEETNRSGRLLGHLLVLVVGLATWRYLFLLGDFF